MITDMVVGAFGLVLAWGFLYSVIDVSAKRAIREAISVGDEPIRGSR